MSEKKGRQRFFTYRDAVFCAFVSLFPGASTEALRYVMSPEKGIFKTADDDCYSVISVRARMKKLHEEGAIETFRGFDRTNLYGASEYGKGVAQALLGEQFAEFYRPLNGISITRLKHFTAIADVASQLISEKHFSIQDTVSGGVTLFDLIPEHYIFERGNAMKRAFQSEKEAGSTSAQSLEEYRLGIAKEMLRELKAGNLDFSEAVLSYPELLCVADKNTLVVPDLVVFLDEKQGRSREKREAKNVAVEVELSMKPADKATYVRRFEVYKRELESRLVYEKLLYVCGSGTILRAVKEAALKVGLSSSMFEAVRLEDFSGHKNTVKPARVAKDPKAKTTLGIPTVRVSNN